MNWTEYLVESILIAGLLGVISFVFLLLRSGKKKDGFYSVRGWNFCLKKYYTSYKIKEWKKYRSEDEIELIDSTEEPLNLNLGLFDSESLKLKNFTNSDCMTVFGTNKEGFSLLIIFSRKSNDTDIILILTLPCGTRLHLPSQGNIRSFDESSSTWKSGGLSLTLLKAFWTWRILFNGILQKQSKSGSTDTEMQHVRFNFIWIGDSVPQRTPDDSSINLMAEAVASEPWRGPNWMDGVTQSKKRGYDQYGSMCGTIIVGEEEETVTTSMYGLRQRVWQPILGTLRRSLTIVGAASEGTIYQIGAESFTDGLTQLKFGHIRLPNGDVQPFESFDLNMSAIGENDSDLPKSFTIKLSTKSKDYVLFISLNKDLKQTFDEKRDWKTVLVPFQAGINGNQGSGFLQLGYAHKGKICKWDFNTRLEWLSLEDLDNEIPLCATFKERVATCPDAVGGKGASLALMASSNAHQLYDVPNGFCLTTRALDCQLNHYPELQKAVQAIIDVNSNYYSELTLKNACERTSKLFESTAVCNKVKDHVLSSFRDLCKSVSDDLENEKLFFAVRSSGVGEDSEELSAAGQNATILGCKTFEDVLKGIQECWSSLFTFQSVEYRRQHGQVVQCGMGVVVQVMVDAKAAGVMFTRHPTTGNPAHIFITSNHGLGESVVSGQIEPDTIIINRDIHDNLSIKSIDVGKKGARIVLDKSKKSGIQTVRDEENAVASLSLSEEECLLLGKIAILQEKLWGLPRDIEWAIDQDRIYLVQARPITSLNSWTEFELAHEADTPVMSEDDLLTFANTGEVMPGSFSPLSLSSIATALNDSISATNGIRSSKYTMKILSSTNYHVGLNVFNTFLRQCEPTITTSTKTLDLAVYGHLVVDENMHTIALYRNKVTDMICKFQILRDMFLFLWRNKSNCEKAIRHAEKLEVDLSNQKTALEMFNYIEGKIGEVAKSSNFHSASSVSSAMSQILFLSIILEGRSDFTSDLYADIGTILSSCSDVISAQIPEELKKIAMAIQSSGKAEEFSIQPPETVMRWLEDNCSGVHHLLTQFLERHGHRCIKEFDLFTDTWGINPTPLMKTLQATVKAPIIETSNDPVSVEQLINQLVSPIKNATKKILKFVVPICQKSVARREGTKSALISVVHKMRLAYHQLGKQMMKEWRLPDEKLLFFMTRAELQTYLQTRNPVFITKAILRRRFFPRWDKLQFSELVWGFARPLTASDNEIVRDGQDGFKITGTPVCSGDIVARACVITSISEIDQLQAGDILITHSTDIGWSPYFPLMGGVVTELGGLISHGAVVAREYGLPCIVGAQRATVVFKTGDMVLLAASKGLLEKVVG